MESQLKEALGTSLLKATSYEGGGCISQGRSYDTDRGRVFVKFNHKPEASKMFLGEMAGLEAILQTKTVKAPKPIKIIELKDGGTACAMEHLDMTSLNRHSAKLGEQLGDLHLYNQKLGEKLEKQQNIVGKGASQSDLQYVEEFGFHTVTCCGYLPQVKGVASVQSRLHKGITGRHPRRRGMVNDWQNDWVSFYSRQRLQTQLDWIEKEYGDREARELWSHLQLKIPELFRDIKIHPALLHGDLWGGNVAEDQSGPVIFDPACFYGHSEFELGIASMFGGFSSSFYTAYHEKLPKADGFNKRQKLYQLFHYLNHWNHFGTGYRGSSLNTMKNLIK